MVTIEKTPTGTDFTEFLCEMAGLAPGIYQISIYPLGQIRSSGQNRYLWGIVYPLLLKGLNEIGYDYGNVKQVHGFCKEVFTDRYVNKHSGAIMDIPDSTREMDTKTFSTYLQVIREWAVEYLSIEIPDSENNKDR